MESPLISIIVPAYNVEKYLDKCINSILNQSYKNIELILVNDGSTDSTGIICDRFSLLDTRIIVHHQKNLGLSGARNAGLSIAKGDYIGFIDGDDYITPNMYEDLINSLLTSPSIKISQASRCEITVSGDILPEITYRPNKKEIVSSFDFIKSLLMHEGDTSMCTKLFHKSVFDNDRFATGELNEDFKLIIQLLLKNDTIILLPSIGYNVVHRDDSLTRSSSKHRYSKVFIDAVNNADWVLSLVSKNLSSLIPIAKRFGYFQRCEYMLHIPISMMTKDNVEYIGIKKYIRKNIFGILFSRYLKSKIKFYMLLFAVAPRFVRKTHTKIKHFD